MLQKLSSFRYYGVVLVLLPLAAAGIFVLAVRLQASFRYDPAYFSPAYQEKYAAPGSVALALERALQTGDRAILPELQGYEADNPPFLPNPNIYTILMEVDEAGYFHYMYYDVKTFDREFHYIKEYNNRWIYVPTGAFFYLDSGQWLRTFAPVAAVYYAVLIVYGLGLAVFRTGRRLRESIFRP